MFGRCTLKDKKGFTLLETIAAFIVFVVMISSAYSLLLEAMKLHKRQQLLVKDIPVILNQKNASIGHIDGFTYQIVKYHHLKLLRFLP